MTSILQLKNKNFTARKKNIENYFAQSFSLAPPKTQINIFVENPSARSLDFNNLTPNPVDIYIHDRSITALLKLLKDSQQRCFLDINTNKSARKSRKKRRDTSPVQDPKKYSAVLDQIECFLNKSNSLREQRLDFTLQEDSNFFQAYRDKDFNVAIKNSWRHAYKVQKKLEPTIFLRKVSEIYRQDFQHRYSLCKLLLSKDALLPKVEPLILENKESGLKNFIKNYEFSHKLQNIYISCDDLYDYTSMKATLAETYEVLPLNDWPIFLGMDIFSTFIFAIGEQLDKHPQQRRQTSLVVDAKHYPDLQAWLVHGS